jgi:hypothetical protein
MEKGLKRNQICQCLDLGLSASKHGKQISVAEVVQSGYFMWQPYQIHTPSSLGLFSVLTWSHLLPASTSHPYAGASKCGFPFWGPPALFIPPLNLHSPL